MYSPSLLHAILHAIVSLWFVKDLHQLRYAYDILFIGESSNQYLLSMCLFDTFTFYFLNSYLKKKQMTEGRGQSLQAKTFIVQ